MHAYIPREKQKQSAVPHGYEKHAQGYQRISLVDHSTGSVHIGVGICQLEPNGTVDYCLHTNEEALYVLEGELEIMRDREAFRLSADDYALVPYGIPHAYRNRGRKAVRWLEAQAPQPKPPGGWPDTFFLDAEWPEEVAKPSFDDPRLQGVGHFREEGGHSPLLFGVRGATVRFFITGAFGAQHMLLHRGALAPEGVFGGHEHPFEESFYALEGEVDLELEGTVYQLRSGDIAWAGVGAAHAWNNRGTVPFRWIETMAPQPPLRNGVLSHAYWDRLRNLR
jgi:quercetin dioxygenase-like cupin family protein